MRAAKSISDLNRFNLGVQFCFQNCTVFGFNKPLGPLGRGKNERDCGFADEKLVSRWRNVVRRVHQPSKVAFKANPCVNVE